MWFQLGVYFLSQLGKSVNKTFTTVEEAKESNIDWTDQVTIGGKKTTIGQLLLNQYLPAPLQDYRRELNNKNVKKVLSELATKYKKDFPTVLNSWKDLGNYYSFKRGTTVSLDDFVVDRSYRDKLIKERLPAINKLEGDKKVYALNTLTLRVEKAQDKPLSSPNRIY